MYVYIIPVLLLSPPVFWSRSSWVSFTLFTPGMVTVVLAADWLPSLVKVWLGPSLAEVWLGPSLAEVWLGPSLAKVVLLANLVELELETDTPLLGSTT